MESMHVERSFEIFMNENAIAWENWKAFYKFDTSWLDND
jgi:hypothetical protein